TRGLQKAADLVVGVAPLVEQRRPERQALGGEGGTVGAHRVEGVRLVHKTGDGNPRLVRHGFDPWQVESCSSCYGVTTPTASSIIAWSTSWSSSPNWVPAASPSRSITTR